MADGNEYEVPHRDYIVLPPRAAYVIVFDQKSADASFDVLPLLTMTGLRQSGNGASLLAAAERQPVIFCERGLAKRLRDLVS